MVWLTLTILGLIAAAVGLVVFRNDFTELQAGMFGAQMRPGCVIAEAVFLLLVALGFFLAYVVGLIVLPF